MSTEAIIGIFGAAACGRGGGAAARPELWALTWLTTIARESAVVAELSNIRFMIRPWTMREREFSQVNGK